MNFNKTYEYIFKPCLHLFYSKEEADLILKMQIHDVYLKDEAIKGSEIDNNEWFIVVDVNENYFNALPVLKALTSFISVTSIGKVSSNLAVIRLKGVDKPNVLKNFKLSKYSQMYNHGMLVEYASNFKEGNEYTNAYHVLFHSTEKFQSLVEKFGFKEERNKNIRDQKEIDALKLAEFDSVVDLNNQIFNSINYGSSLG